MGGLEIPEVVLQSSTRLRIAEQEITLIIMRGLLTVDQFHLPVTSEILYYRKFRGKAWGNMGVCYRITTETRLDANCSGLLPVTLV
jgi:hypothetical protein